MYQWYLVWPQPVPSTLVASKETKKLSECRPTSSSMENNGLDMVHPYKSPKRSVLPCLLYISSSCLYWSWSNMFQEVTNDNEKHESNLSRVVASGRDMSCHHYEVDHLLFLHSFYDNQEIHHKLSRRVCKIIFHSQSWNNIKSFYLGGPSL